MKTAGIAGVSNHFINDVIPSGLLLNYKIVSCE